MKLFLHSGDLDEIRQEGQRGVIAGVTVDLTACAGGSARERHDLVAAIVAAVDVPVSVEVPVTTLAAMVGEAEALSALAANVMVAFTATPDGQAAIRRCSARGIVTLAVGCQSPADVELGARAGARFVSPAFVDGSGDGLVLAAVRMADGTLRTYARPSRVLMGPMRRANQVLEAAVGGALAASVVFPVLQRLLALGTAGRRGPGAASPAARA